MSSLVTLAGMRGAATRRARADLAGAFTIPGKSMRAAHEGCVVSDSVTLRRQIPGMNLHTPIQNAP
ncbi:hypothetical protein [Burkholderia diffusa]|uniref:hypothetical protein n=1 Tax=Burkholderia diffusa TaxID=488732 RepID=UPI000841E1D1|nr:hypothetical protein [Burkholderia diffusa]AOI61684.1 hypothetical protein WI26_28860 [Burkholderia diffusa]